MSVAVAFPKAPAQKLQRARLDSTSHRGCLMRVAPLRSSWAIAVAATLALSACKMPPSAPPPPVPEGGEVKAGQSLYTIDQAAYQAKLDSARASLAKAEAALASARAQAERYTPL